MEARAKGTVTSLSSLFPVEEAQKASKRVQDTIADRQKQLDLLRDFAADNNNLINLVQRLPDQLHHDIMVPFGKAAFFPGSLIHTNEFLVKFFNNFMMVQTFYLFLVSYFPQYIEFAQLCPLFHFWSIHTRR